MASLPVMGLLANNHLGERGLFAYVDLKCGVATIYVPFVDVPVAVWKRKVRDVGEVRLGPLPSETLPTGRGSMYGIVAVPMRTRRHGIIAFHFFPRGQGN